MVDRTLNIANIAACVAAAAGNAFTGGAVTLISAALSGTTLWRDLTRPEKTRAQQMAEALDQHLKRSHLTPDRRKITAQIVASFPPTLDDMAHGDMDAEKIAGSMRAKVENSDTDPAYQTPVAFDDYAAALRTILPPLLEPNDRVEAMGRESLQRLHRLEQLLETSGEAERLHKVGITVDAIVKLAQRIARDTDDLGQAWIELRNAMEIAVQVQSEGHTASNHGDFVDEVLRRVADLTAEGDYAGAGDAIEQALTEDDAAHRARKSRLLDSGAEIAMLQGDAGKAADYLICKADLDAGGQAGFESLRALQDSYHEKGRDRGTALDLEIAIALARLIHARGSSADQRGTALNALAISLRVIGERESGPARLEEAVVTFRAALEERPRVRVPLHWAMTQQNLGNALKTLGERQGGIARLEEAVAAYRAALQEWTRDRVPFEWANAQMNLGTALQSWGARESGTARLEQAVTAYHAALEEWTRDRVPLEWATAQQNLGTALRDLGARESGTARLEQAVVAFRAALEVIPRDRVPLQWAVTQMNLGSALARLGERESGTARLEEAVTAFRTTLEEVTLDRAPLDWAMTQANLAELEIAFFDKTGDTAHLDRAEGHAWAAREVFVAAQASRYVEINDNILADIAARRGG